MKELTNPQIYMMLTILSIGIAMVVTRFIPIIFISVGITLIVIITIFFILENGLCFWHWWVLFRMGFCVRISDKSSEENRYKIDDWLKENIRFKFMYHNDNDDYAAYYFWRNSDAMGFKLRWI